MHYRKMISTFHKDSPKKSIVTLLLINSTLLITKPTAKLVTKPINTFKIKCGQSAKAFVKQTREILSNYLDSVNVE